MTPAEQAVRDSIEHWKRMRKWVAKTQFKNEPVRAMVMVEAIGEEWSGECCPLCQWSKALNCSDCPLPLAQDKYRCSYSYSPWNKVNQAKTWSEWLAASDEMMNVLRKCLLKTNLK